MGGNFRFITLFPRACWWSLSSAERYYFYSGTIIALCWKELLVLYMLVVVSEVLDMSEVLYVPHALHYCPTGDVSYFEEAFMVFTQICIPGVLTKYFYVACLRGFPPFSFGTEDARG
jgi:hypothetical protein